MMKYLFSIALLLLPILSLADSDIQSQISNEYGNCYGHFQENVASCTLSTCNYPDLSDSKAWRAQVIRGFKGEQCYIVYYSYINDQILGSPDHCLYTREQMRILSDLYKSVFSDTSLIAVSDSKAKINGLNLEVCKKLDETQ